MVERLNNLSKINIYALLFIIVTNTLSIFIRGASYIYFLTNILPFSLSILALLIFRKHAFKINSFLMLLLGLALTLIGGSGNFSGAVFIIYSIHMDESRNKTIFKLALMTICVAIKTLFNDITTIQVINLLFVNYLAYGYYYILFTEKKVVTIHEIEDQTEQIIEYLQQGFTVKEISIKTFMSIAAVNKRINRLRDKEKCKTTYQLIYKLSQNGQKANKIDRFKVI